MAMVWTCTVLSFVAQVALGIRCICLVSFGIRLGSWCVQHDAAGMYNELLAGVYHVHVIEYLTVAEQRQKARCKANA